MPTTEFYPSFYLLSPLDALPICDFPLPSFVWTPLFVAVPRHLDAALDLLRDRTLAHQVPLHHVGNIISEDSRRRHVYSWLLPRLLSVNVTQLAPMVDRKSTRLNYSQ